MHKATTTVRDMVGEALRKPTDAQLELFLFVLGRDHGIKADEVIYDNNKPRIVKAIRDIIGESAESSNKEKQASEGLPAKVGQNEGHFELGSTEAS